MAVPQTNVTHDNLESNCRFPRKSAAYFGAEKQLDPSPFKLSNFTSLIENSESDIAGDLFTTHASTHASPSQEPKQTEARQSREIYSTKNLALVLHVLLGT